MKIGITGHQRWPAQAQAAIEAGIAAALAQAFVPIIGVTSLAAGADQLFARMVLARGGTLHVVLPCRRYEEAFTDSAARDEYLNLLGQAAGIETLDYDAPTEPAFAAAGFRVVDLAALLVAVWDGAAARGHGGTAEVVAYARGRGVPVRATWPVGVSR